MVNIGKEWSPSLGGGRPAATPPLRSGGARGGRAGVTGFASGSTEHQQYQTPRRQVDVRERTPTSV
jgi:hypothetical protein